MAKDPAFLFYPGDWLGGTMLLTRHQKGCYIDLLMAQFNKGPLSLEQIKTVLGQDQAQWAILQEKFIKDPQGMYYNEKMATEVFKRKNFVATRSNGKAGRKQSYEQSHENHMKGHTDNRNENEDLNALWINTKIDFFNDFRWCEKFCREKNLLPLELKRQMQEFIKDVDLSEQVKDLKELKNHFLHSFNKGKYSKEAKQISTPGQLSETVRQIEEQRKNK